MPTEPDGITASPLLLGIVLLAAAFSGCVGDWETVPYCPDDGEKRWAWAGALNTTAVKVVDALEDRGWSNIEWGRDHTAHDGNGWWATAECAELIEA